jgi:hypothetical protein
LGFGGGFGCSTTKEVLVIIWINRNLKEYVIVVAQLRLVNFPLWQVAIKRGAFVVPVELLTLSMNGEIGDE